LTVIRHRVYAFPTTETQNPPLATSWISRHERPLCVGAYGKSYSSDGIGRLTNYEGTALIVFGACGGRRSSAVYTGDAVGHSWFLSPL